MLLLVNATWMWEGSNSNCVRMQFGLYLGSPCELSVHQLVVGGMTFKVHFPT